MLGLWHWLSNISRLSYIHLHIVYLHVFLSTDLPDHWPDFKTFTKHKNFILVLGGICNGSNYELINSASQK